MNLKPLLLLSLLVAFGQLAAEQVGPWDLDALKANVPAMKWVRQDQPVHSLTYTGETYKGHPSQVFAFYASPVTLGEVAAGTKTFPGVVLIHGGGGTAFADWAYLWAKRGYAAIAMDLGGTRPPDPVFDPKTGAPVGHQSEAKFRTPLPDGGPPQGGTEKFNTIGGNKNDQWPFHAVANAMRAHSLLRSFPEVQAEHTAVTGISWGGYTTCLVASLDDRFKAAVPVYGCGFLHEGESVQKPMIDALGDLRDKWVKTYDPGSLLPRCHVPIFFVNGSNDVHYVLDSYMKSYNAARNTARQIREQVKMPHGHEPGWAPKEIGVFIDSVLLDKPKLPQVSPPVQEGRNVAAIVSDAAVASANVQFTVDENEVNKHEWQSVDATIDITGTKSAIATTKLIATIPDHVKLYFFTVTTAEGLMVSSPVVIKSLGR